MSFLQERGLEAKPLPWQHCRMRLYVSFLRDITGAKFRIQCCNISRDIPDFVICLHTVTTYDVITYFLLNLNTFRTREDIAKKKKSFFYILKGLSNKLNLVFTSYLRARDR